MAQGTTIYYCRHCDGRDYKVGKVKKLGKCERCGKDTRYELLVEI